MKRIINNIAFVALALFGATSCTPMVEDVFDKPSSERIEEYYNEVDKILKSSEEGWRMEYYASTTYGGYSVFCKFEGSNVTFASEKVGSTHPAGVDENGQLVRATSHYKMEQSMGAVISFDSYNPVFHYFSEPKNSDFGTSGEGMSGDFEFRVRSACADSVILIGKKHQSKIRMYPIAKGTTWEDYYNKVQNTEKTMTARTYYLFKDGVDKEVTINTSYRRLVFNYINEEGVATAEGAPYIVTETGYKFYKPYTINGMTIEELLMGSEDGIYKASNDPTIWIEAQTLPLVEQLNNSMWFITYDNLGAFAQPYWDQFKAALEKAGTNQSKATLYWALIGSYSGKKGYHMNAGGDQASIGFSITAENEEGDIVKIKYNSKDSNKAGTNFYDKFKLKEALIPFIGKTKVSSRTFKLTVDNARRPSYMILTDLNEPTNVIRLEAQEVYYPFGDEPLD